MSSAAENNARLALYQELDDIVGAMKNLAQVELVRLEKALGRQQSMFQDSVAALQTLARHYALPPVADNGQSLLLALGSERGFCGGFNEQISRAVTTLEPVNQQPSLVVGSRLLAKWPPDAEANNLPAPTTIDELLPGMQSILDTLRETRLPAQIQVLSHTKAGVSCRQLWPFPEPPDPERSTPTKPSASLALNLDPAELSGLLRWQCLQQGLMYYLLQSLSVENHMRLQQMEGARDHLEELTQELRLRINAQRQQQIVEEIEVILAEQRFD